MQRSDCHVGQRVIFGRPGPRAEKTLGEIVKLNPKKAKVKILEDRGQNSQAGQIWGVPYSLMAPAPADAQPGPAGQAFEEHFNRQTAFEAARAEEPLEYNMFQPAEEQLILEAILCCYSNLSPENLTCDGEAPMSHVRRVKADMERKLNHLQKALGRTVSETAVYAWYDQKRKAEQERKAS